MHERRHRYLSCADICATLVPACISLTCGTCTLNTEAPQEGKCLCGCFDGATRQQCSLLSGPRHVLGGSEALTDNKQRVMSAQFQHRGRMYEPQGQKRGKHVSVPERQVNFSDLCAGSTGFLSLYGLCTLSMHHQ